MEHVWRPGSVGTRWGELMRSPDPLAAMGGYLEGGKGMDGRGREGSGKSLLLRETRGNGTEGGIPAESQGE